MNSPSKLIRWNQVSVQELHKSGCSSSLIKFNFQERVNRFFLATFQNGEGCLLVICILNFTFGLILAARLHCIICITPNYPLTTPIMSVLIELTEKQKEPYTIQQKVFFVSLMRVNYYCCYYCIFRTWKPK